MSAPLLTPAEAGARLGLAVQTLSNWRSTGEGPLPWVELSPRCIRYRPEDIADFIEKRVRGGRS